MRNKRETSDNGRSDQRRGGIEEQIRTRIGLDALMVFVVVALAVIFMVRAVVMETKQEELVLQSERVAYQLGDVLDQYTRMTETLAVNPEVRALVTEAKAGGSITEAESWPTVFENLQNVAGLDSENVLATWVADIDANMVGQSDGFVSRKGEFDVTSREWYACTEVGHTVLTEPYEDVSTGDMVLTAATPVYDKSGKKILGVVGIDVTMGRLNEMMEKHRIGETGFVVLLSEKRTILSHPSEDMLYKNISEADLSQNVLDAIEAEEARFLKYKQGGRTQYGQVTQVSDTGYMVVSVLPGVEYYEDLVRLIVVLVVLFAIGMVVLQFGLRRVATRITRPLRELNQTALKLAEGDLDVSLQINSNDEVGELGASINETVKRLKEYIAYIDEVSEVLAKMAEGKLAIELKYDYVGEFQKVKQALLNISDSMNEVMLGISESAEQVTAGADDLARASQSLAGGAGTQAAAVEELVATVTSITEQVEENKTEAENSAKEAMQVVTKMEESQEQMKRMMEAMSKIHQTSREVVGIIKTIEEIADQTNLLALNASIEAARAGEAGRGFAVVAGEIGNLADQSAKAVNTTRDMIGVSLEEIERGNTLAEEVVASLKASVEAVENVNGKIQRTSENAVCQAMSIEQIKEGIEEISQTVQDNSAMAQESSATSEELAAQATTLNEMVQKFELKR